MADLSGRRLYLQLLKRAVTGTLHGDEPDRNDPDFERWRQRFNAHYFGSRVAFSCLPLVRLDQIEAAFESIIDDEVAGDLVEAGVWRGGAAIFMRGLLEAFGDQRRTLWLADSFAGLPEPDAARFPIEAMAHASSTMRDDLGFLAVPLEEVKANFTRFGLLDQRVRFLPGWFKDTLADAPIGPIALLHLDADYHDSTMEVLDALYDKVSLGGFVIVDDYGEDGWTECRKAIDDFRGAHGITDPIEHVDRWCAYWRRTEP